MSLRLVQVVVPAAVDPAVVLADVPVVASWSAGADAAAERVLHAVVPAGEVEPILDRLEAALGPGSRVTVLPVESHRPEPASPEPDAKDVRRFGRVSRDELRADLSEGADASRAYLALVALSALVCAIGLLRDDVAVLIAGMVIAPLLGPNIALALAATLGDGTLARRALATNVRGLLVALGLALLAGWLLPVNLGTDALAARASVDLRDVLLALAAGVAGTLSYTSARQGAIIGVMVAVALVPPLVACGLLLGSGQWKAAAAAAVLTAVNVTCVNLAAVTTFLVQGVRPRTWWEAERAANSSRVAVATWLAVLLALVLLLTVGRSWVGA